MAARALEELGAFHTKARMTKNIVRAIETVAMRLGNTKAVCRKCYIHPVILDSYMDGSLIRHLNRQAGKTLAESIDKLTPEEAAVLALLRAGMRRESQSRKRAA